jgi:hypothetical protein
LIRAFLLISTLAGQPVTIAQIDQPAFTDRATCEASLPVLTAAVQRIMDADRGTRGALVVNGSACLTEEQGAAAIGALAKGRSKPFGDTF